MQNIHPAQLVDYALELATGGAPKMVHKIGTFAGWDPELLGRAYAELVDRHNMTTGMGWKDRNQYRGVLHALFLARDNAITGPHRRRAA